MTVVNDDRKKSNNIITNKNNNKFQFKKRTSNTSPNATSGQTRNDNIDGKTPKYSNQRQIPIKNFTNANIVSVR